MTLKVFEMIYVLIGMSILFIAVGFILTVKNAKYLLSGYNTMSEEERRKFDIASFVPYFKKFHIALGISFLFGGLITSILISELAGGVFLGIYPILAYIYFIWNSQKYTGGTNTSSYKVGMYVLVGTLILVLVLFGYGFKESKLVIKSNSIEISGPYGEKAGLSQIESVEMVDQFPEIRFKKNGFALGAINKGYFKTKDGVIIKLIINTEIRPFILIVKKSGDKLYFSSKDVSNTDIYDEIIGSLPVSR